MEADAADPEFGEQFLEDMLAQAHEATPMDIPVLANRCAEAFGIDEILIYLTDLQQRWLVPLTDGLPPLDVDASCVAGATGPFRHGWRNRGTVCASGCPWSTRRTAGGARGSHAVPGRRPAAALPDAGGDPGHGDRLEAGVQRQLRPAGPDRAHAVARGDAPRLPPPRTIGNAHVVSTAVLEPAYEIGGDAFDHSLTQSTLHAAILDAMGHDLASGLTTSVALAGCRNARRAGAGCPTLWRPSTRPSPSGFPTSTARASSPSSTSPRAY